MLLRAVNNLKDHLKGLNINKCYNKIVNDMNYN